eukprot:3681873-Rhodomonas_salina.1
MVSSSPTSLDPLSHLHSLDSREWYSTRTNQRLLMCFGNSNMTWDIGRHILDWFLLKQSPEYRVHRASSQFKTSALLPA